MILAVAFLVRLAVAWQLHDHPMMQPRPGLDGDVYLSLARQVAAGDLLAGRQVFFLSPFYTYFAALVLALGGSTFALLVVQAVLGTAAVWLVARTASGWFGRQGGQVAAALAAGTGYFAFNEILVLQSAVDPFLTALGLWLVARAWKSGRLRDFLWAGAALGLHILNRPNVLAWAGVALVATAAGEWWLRNAERRTPNAECTIQSAGRPKDDGKRATRPGVTELIRPATWLLAGLLIVLAPVALRNYTVAGQLAIVSSHGGLNFYIGNNPQADGMYGNVPGITPSVAGQITDMRRVAGEALGREVSDVEASEWFYSRAWAWIRDEPGAATALFLKKLAFVFNATDIPLNESYAYYASDESLLLRLLFVGPWLLLPLALAGIWLARGWTTPRSRAAWWGLALFVPVYALSVAAFFVTGRYRLPLLVAACVFAPGAILAIWDQARARAWRRLAPAAALVAVFGAAVNANVGLDNGLGDWRAEMVLQEIQAGRDAEAAATLERALDGHRNPALVLFRAGQAYMRRRTPASAVPLFERAAALAPSRPDIRLAAGEALLVVERAADAIPHLRAAVAGGVGDGSAPVTLARALAEGGQRGEALAALARLQGSEGLPPAAQAAAGRLALEFGKPTVAESFLKRAVGANGNDASAREALALSLAMQGRSNEAIPMMEAACRLDPTSASSRLNLAILYAETGRKADAHAMAIEALRLRPDYEQARQLLRALTRQ